MKCPKKIELFEELAAHYKEVYKLPPLAAKVYSFFLVETSSKEYSFDELVEKFQVSKSSMSSTLHLLSQYDFVSQLNKLGDRKTYYKITPQHLTIRLNRIKRNLEQEILLTDKLIQFHKKESPNFNQLSVDKVKIYTQHLQTSVKGLATTIEKIEKLNHTI
ncbi:GbsR/MarR family transcriptional regulator [Moheibacter stercoris]|uniref:DNA-binding transcriptional regulator GbsR (MarR family) n=1 Tax=Moheibacter stercoris TaxID=1628251 RepID=A0ABV2LYI1_9FLAO